MKTTFLKFIICVSLVGCIPSFNRERKPEPVEFSISERSPLTKKDYFKLTIDSLNNYLYINLATTKALADFQFPKDKRGNILSGIAFNFRFLKKGKEIEGLDLNIIPEKKTYFGYNKWLNKNIRYSSDTFDLRYPETMNFKIPLFAFAKLKAGVQELELQCSQTVFCSGSAYKITVTDTTRRDTSTKYVRNYSPVSLLSFKAKFKINIPPVFKTTLYGHGIELRNDSVYSPAGMDNTIWNSSYPDIYWTISYPDHEHYCSSDYQKSTDLYDTKDTFYLYHYTPYDSIYIGVWDHDNLSRDDYISYERFSLKKFSNNSITKFAFDNVKEFQLRVLRQGFINK